MRFEPKKIMSFDNNKTNFQKVDDIVDEFHKSREKEAKELGYENKVDEILVILGYKQEPKYETMLDAVKMGWKPKTLDISETIRVYGAIDAVLNTLAKMRVNLKKMAEEKLGSNFSENWRDVVGLHLIILDVVSTEYTGKWIKLGKIPEGWISLDKYSPHFVKKSLFKGTKVFAVPKPIEEMIIPLY